MKPFENDGEPAQPKKQVGLKMKNKPSSPKFQPPSIEEKAETHLSKDEAYKQKIWEYSLKYKSLIESSILPENKTSISSSIEKEIIDALISVPSEMNDDINQPNCIGSTALSMLLMKCMLLQRDRINELSFKLDKLEKRGTTS